MPQPREPRGRNKGSGGVDSRFSAARADDPSPRAAGSGSGEPGLLRDDPEAFSDLLSDAAKAGGVDAFLVERDYWMCQLASSLIANSKRHPGSYTSMGGGSLLALTGITQRISEDIDLTVTYAQGIARCTPKIGKRLMEECQTRAEAALGLQGVRRNRDGTKPLGGGNFFRTVYYAYPSSLAGDRDEPREVQVDKGVRDAPIEHLSTSDGMPYMGRAARSMGIALPEDLSPRPIRGAHPLQILADKLDAVCWREALAGTQGHEMLDALVKRVRDHYDIYHLIRWLRPEGMLTAEAFLAAVERSIKQEEALRARMKITRPVRARPRQGYHTLRAWTAGTDEHAALSAAHTRLSGVVYGPMPRYEDVCAAVHTAAGAI